MTEYLSKKIRVLSLLAIVAVVYVHAYNLQDRYLVPFTISHDRLSVASFTELFISNGLTRFAVPIFFAISGYLFFRNLEPDPLIFFEKFVKRLRTLALPYVLWSSIGLVLIWLVQQTEWGRHTVDTWDLLPPAVSFDLLLYRWLINPVPFQLWFIRDLMLYVILSPLIYASVRYGRLAPIILVGLLWLVHINFVIMEAEGILFFLIGAYLAVHRIALPERVSGWLPGVALALWLPLLTIKTLLAFNPTPPLTLILLHKLAILCGVITVWFGYDHFGETLNDDRTLAAMVPFTAFIYFTHEPLLNFLTNFALYQWGDIPPLTIYLTYPLVTVSLCLFLGAVLRTYVPPVFSLLTGGRGN